MGKWFRWTQKITKANNNAKRENEGENRAKGGDSPDIKTSSTVGSRGTLNLGNKGDRLFCEIGIDLGLFTAQQAADALEEQRVEEIVGNKLQVGAFLFKKGLVGKDQINTILKMQDRIENTKQKSIDSDPKPRKHYEKQNSPENTLQVENTATTPIGLYVIAVLCTLSVFGQVGLSPSDIIDAVSVAYGVSFFTGLMNSISIVAVSVANIACLIIVIAMFQGNRKYAEYLQTIISTCFKLVVGCLLAVVFQYSDFSYKELNSSNLKEAIMSTSAQSLQPARSYLANTRYVPDSELVLFAKSFLWGLGYGYGVLAIQWGILLFCAPNKKSSPGDSKFNDFLDSASTQ